MVPPAEVGHEAPIGCSPGGHPLVNASTPPSGRISAWVAIAAVPTMIAGIYGMNFDTMPEVRWHLGYPAVLVFMASVAGLLHRAFRRSGWL